MLNTDRGTITVVLVIKIILHSHQKIATLLTTNKWQVTASNAEENRQACSSVNGTTESAKINCVDYEKCKIPKNNGCDDNQTLDTTFNPPICVDNAPVCTEKDTSFPVLKNQESVIYSWVPPDNLAGQCTNQLGKVQEAQVTCERNYRCMCPYEAYPPKAENEKVLFSWDGNNDRSTECLIANGEGDKGRVACSDTYRCVAPTEEPNKECGEQVGSYVSPNDGTFDEDITLTGTDFGLHYSSEMSR